MDSCEIIITNMNLIEPKHKCEHEPYEYNKYEVSQTVTDIQSIMLHLSNILFVEAI
jgi:hypothetical protein